MAPSPPAPPAGARTIDVDDPRAPDVKTLLERHLAFTRATSPPEDVHALDLEGLLDPAVTFFSCRVEGVVLGIGALKHLDAHHAELKSMHTAEESRGRGIGRAMVDHLVEVARRRGCTRVSLETGTGEPFAAAHQLYQAAGFVECGPFADYRPSVNSTFMYLTLDASDGSAASDGG